MKLGYRRKFSRSSKAVARHTHSKPGASLLARIFHRSIGRCSKPISLTPCFSWVIDEFRLAVRTVSTVSTVDAKPLKRFEGPRLLYTPLKQGVNESHLIPAPRVCEISGLKRASVLVGLLWMLALLAVTVTSVLYTARMDLMVAKNYVDSVQAQYIALAGAEKAKALIFHEAAERKRSVQHHTGSLYDSSEYFKDIDFGRGKFRVVRQGTSDDGGRLIYGISDEESRLNVNTASLEELRKLYGMTPELAAAILDWHDSNKEPSPGGAETDYYTSLRRPYLPRDGNIQTAREMLLVRDVTPALLLGEDANQNGLLDPEEDDGPDSDPPDNRDGVLDHGWAGYLSFETTTQNVTAAGEDKVDVQTASEKELTEIPGITPEIAKAIIAHRDQNRLENIADLMNVGPANPQGQRGGQPENPPPGQRGRGGGGNSGPKVIDEDLFLQIADHVKTSPESARRGLININTAPLQVLMCLQGMTEELAYAIINFRSSTGFFPSIGHLLKVPGLSREVFQRLAPKVTVRSENFRIISEGVVPSSGARRRIELIVRLTSRGIDTISYRENL
jgi:DNA uptake protein ComE-like DNA-binding protein